MQCEVAGDDGQGKVGCVVEDMPAFGANLARVMRLHRRRQLDPRRIYQHPQ
jgi:hypothetical protein